MVGSGQYLLRLRSDGTVESVQVVQSTGHRELDQSCVEAFHTWHFKPKLVQVIRKVKIPVTFTMDGVHY
jgi:TonB family protein